MEWISDHPLLVVMANHRHRAVWMMLLLGERSSNRGKRQIDVWGETFQNEIS
jgi:hypothetical protein